MVFVHRVTRWCFSYIGTVMSRKECPAFVYKKKLKNEWLLRFRGRSSEKAANKEKELRNDPNLAIAWHQLHQILIRRGCSKSLPALQGLSKPGRGRMLCLRSVSKPAQSNIEDFLPSDTYFSTGYWLSLNMTNTIWSVLLCPCASWLLTIAATMHPLIPSSQKSLLREILLIKLKENTLSLIPLHIASRITFTILVKFFGRVMQIIT